MNIEIIHDVSLFQSLVYHPFGMDHQHHNNSNTTNPDDLDEVFNLISPHGNNKRNKSNTDRNAIYMNNYVPPSARTANHIESSDSDDSDEDEGKIRRHPMFPQLL